MKNHFFDSLVNTMIKIAEEGYEGNASDTIFGEKPMDPSKCQTPSGPVAKKLKRGMKAKAAPKAPDQYPKAPGPNDMQQ